MIVYPADDAGSCKVRADGVAEMIVGETTVMPSTIFKIKFLLGQLLGSPLPMSETTPPLREIDD